MARLLAACVREHDWSVPPPEAAELLQGVEPNELLAAADYHKVAGSVRASLRALPELDPGLLGQLEARHRFALGQQMQAEHALRQAARALDAEGLPWLVIKGPVLEQAVYSQRRLRSFGDLDLLVPRRALAAALDALERDGMRCVDRNWQLICRMMAGELHVVPEFGAEIDLHWELLFSDSLRRRFPLAVDDMIMRAHPVEVAGIRTHTFEPADTVLHLALHAALEGGDRLIWLKDLEQAVLRLAPDWDSVVRRARAWRIQLHVGTMLARSRAGLGTPVPDAVVADLLPPGWRSVVRMLDRAFPAARSSGLGTPATLVARSTRESVPATLLEMLAGLAVRTSGLAAGRVERLDVREDPSDPGSLHYPAGGDAERARFLAAVSGDALSPA